MCRRTHPWLHGASSPPASLCTLASPVSPLPGQIGKEAVARSAAVFCEWLGFLQDPGRFPMNPAILLLLILAALPLGAQGTAPAFQYKVDGATYTLLGRDPAQGGTTSIPVLLVPVKLSFEANRGSAQPFVMDAAGDVNAVLRSPVFTAFPFPGGAPTQYLDAMLHATLTQRGDWKLLLGKPEVKPLAIAVPAGYGYILTSKISGKSIAVADREFLQRELFRQIPKEPGRLVIAVTHNTTYYSAGDATLCCSWGAHGVDSASGNSFVLGSYLRDAPDVVEDQDIQPLTQQLGQFLKDPLHDPLIYGRNVKVPGNAFPAWLRPSVVAVPDQRPCGGTGASTMYFSLDPTDHNPKNNIPASKAYVARQGGVSYHLQNVALLSWYAGSKDALGKTFSFPDARALPQAAEACPAGFGRGGGARNTAPSEKPVAWSGPPNGHELIGYWAGYGGPGSTIPLRQLSPQWDVILVAFSTPDRDAPEGTMKFPTPGGLDTEQFKADIAWLKSQGKKVMISLGGGGQHFTLANPARVPNFVASVKRIVEQYGFDGIDIDFESPSLSIDPGDVDFRRPTTPSIVNLISAIRQLRDHFGPKFLVSLVPEGTQIPSGYPSYGGQFGSYLPIAYALRDVLTFMDVQDYNTPPLLGLDGEIYQPGTVDYHAAMTELVLQGFPVGGDPKYMFPPLPPNQVAVGFLTSDTTPAIVSQAMQYLITGKAPAGTRYKLRQPAGYPQMLGAMFWTIDADRRANYKFSNMVGPQLHAYPQR